MNTDKVEAPAPGTELIHAVGCAISIMEQKPCEARVLENFSPGLKVCSKDSTVTFTGDGVVLNLCGDCLWGATDIPQRLGETMISLPLNSREDHLEHSHDL